MIKLLTPIFLLLALVPFFVYAHDGGRSLERQVGNYLIDIGYTPEELIAGKSAYFDFKLYEKGSSPGSADYTQVWVRIEKDGETVFASGIANMNVGTVGMVYAFADGGEYTISARYEKGETVIVETAFALEVADEQKGVSFGVREVGTFVLGAVLIAGVFVVYRRRFLKDAQGNNRG